MSIQIRSFNLFIDSYLGRLIAVMGFRFRDTFKRFHFQFPVLNYSGHETGPGVPLFRTVLLEKRLVISDRF